MQRVLLRLICGGIDVERFRRLLFSFLALLSEYITLISTILATAYILISSQYKEYSTEVLLLWTISLLGLIATSIATEKSFKLRKIERGINEIKLNIKGGENSLDKLFFARRNLSPLEERLNDCSDLIITGGSLARLSDEYYGLFENKLNEGCSIEVILVEPNTEAVRQLCRNIVYETSDCDIYSRKISESIQRFAELKRKFPKGMKILLSDLVPPFSIMAKNLNKEKSIIQVELYSYAVPTRERVEFNVGIEDSNTYSFFANQIEVLRENATEFEM